MSRRARALLPLLMLMAFAWGCEPVAPILPRSAEPGVYVLLTPEGLRAPESLDLYAFVLTTGHPLAAEYRTAERFEMRRAGEVQLFDWRHNGPEGELGSIEPLASSGNYVLTDEPAVGRLGSLDVTPGRYTLEIETGGVLVRGEAAVPREPALEFVRNDDGRWAAVWSSDELAGGYTVSYNDAQQGVYIDRDPSPDTAFVLPENWSRSARVAVSAYDANYYRYLFDDRMGRSGIDRGFGFFGGMSAASIPLEELWDAGGRPGSAPRTEPEVK